MKKQKGFQLIEAMIILAICGIITAIVLPAYLNYDCRKTYRMSNVHYVNGHCEYIK